MIGETEEIGRGNVEYIDSGLVNRSRYYNPSFQKGIMQGDMHGCTFAAFLHGASTYSLAVEGSASRTATA